MPRYIVVHDLKSNVVDGWIVRDTTKSGLDQYSHELACVDEDQALLVALALNRQALQDSSEGIGTWTRSSGYSDIST